LNRAPLDGAALEIARVIFGQLWRRVEYLIDRVHPPHLDRGASGKPHEKGQVRHLYRTPEEEMKRLISLCAIVPLALILTPTVNAQSNPVQPGTQIRLTLVRGVTTTVAHDGDPFIAMIAEPVFFGNQMVLPAGAKLHGTVTSVTRPKFFSMFRGGASMNLVFNSIEVESRIFPAQLSILSIYTGGADSGKARKDLKTVEGVVIKERRDIKADVTDVAIGTAGGSLVGVIFSQVVRGSVVGLVGGGAYIMAKKGKDVELPAQTGMLVRLDSPVSLPSSLLHNAAYVTTSR
jgi:hypothetical protein